MGPRSDRTVLGADVDELRRWFQRLPLPWRRWRVTAVVESAADVPELLPYRGAALVVFSNRRPGWLAFDCPCREAHRVMLNLDPERYPWWQTLDLDPLTIQPSVNDFSTARYCHYFIHAGRVIWAKNTNDLYGDGHE